MCSMVRSLEGALGAGTNHGPGRATAPVPATEPPMIRKLDRTPQSAPLLNTHMCFCYREHGLDAT